MKKVLLSAVVLSGVLGSLSAGAADPIATSRDASISSHIITDSRNTVNLVQAALMESASAVRAVLRAIEDTDDLSGFDTIPSSISEGSYPGLDAMSVTDGVVKFTFSGTELGSGVGTWYAEYTPVTENTNTVVGWNCKTTASTDTGLGKAFVKPSAGEIDPIMKGLGWPYAGCVVVAANGLD